MSGLNNADVRFIGGLGLMECEEVDADKHIWRGKIIHEEEKGSFMWTYFSRLYSPDNDLDKMLHEYVIEDESILGVKFMIVPREKIMFRYTPPTTIIRVPHKIGKRMGGM